MVSLVELFAGCIATALLLCGMLVLMGAAAATAVYALSPYVRWLLDKDARRRHK